MLIHNTRLVDKECHSISDLSGIAQQCDAYVHHEQYMNVSGAVHPQTIFMNAQTEARTIPFFLRTILPCLVKHFVIVIASHDYTFPRGIGDLRHNPCTALQSEIAALLRHTLLICAFVENLDSGTEYHPKLRPLPLGLLSYSPTCQLVAANVQNIISDREFSERPLDVCCVQRMRSGGNGQWLDRDRVTQYISNGSWKGIRIESHCGDEVDPERFVKLVQRSRFCVCVHGGGIDPSPKCWEAILLGCIPIIQHSTLDGAYARLPVAFVDAWTSDCITPQKLQQWLRDLQPYFTQPAKRSHVLSMMTTDYWMKEVKRPLAKDDYKSGAIR